MRRHSLSLALLLSTAFLIGSYTRTSVSAGAPPPPTASGDLDQCANGGVGQAPVPCSAAAWQNGNLNQNQAHYREGDSIPYRLRLDGLTTGTATHTVTIEWDTTQNGKHALDYLTSFNRTETTANPCSGVANCVLNGSQNSTAAIQQDTNVPFSQAAGVFTLFNGQITGLSTYTLSGTYLGTSATRVTINFQATTANPVLAWGGHISTRLDWPGAPSAVDISGSPYHMRLVDVDGKSGNQDRSLSASAVVFPGSITVIKDASPSGTTSFDFTTTGGLTPSSFSLVDDNDTNHNTRVFGSLLVPSQQVYTITETEPQNWDLNGITCSVTSANGGSYTASVASATATITLKEGENWSCTFNNMQQQGNLKIVKQVQAGGSTTQAFDFSTNFDPASFSLTHGQSQTFGLAAGTYSVSEQTPGGWEQVSATCDNGNAVSSIQVAAGQTVVCTFTNKQQLPAIDLVKGGTLNDANHTSKVDVGDTISYTFTVTNTGNVALTGVAVTDPLLSGGTISCPKTTLNPQESMTCTATYAITQQNINSGSVVNTAQACGTPPAGATPSPACDSDSHTQPLAQSPHLAITKQATETGYSAVGNVIHYTIVATNDGNTTLSAVTVSDPKVTGLSCTPANGSALAPGASMNCTATHTITQADLDAGHYANTACVNGSPATEQCASKDVNATQNPHLAITKTATEPNYDGVGDVIHYTIVATNDGNTTLSAVTVSDPKVTGLSCTPANGSPLAPGASMSCTATHTITQADLDAGHYANTACVNGGTATQQCATKDVDALENPHLAITKQATETTYSAVGNVIHYTIVATNDGNTTLSAVTVTDPKVTGLTCTPANGTSLAPGASMNCTATHTITQADIDAGHYANTACVNGAPATQQCASKDVNGTQNPHLAITKTATEPNYDSVGDVIHYTIVATNDGNTTLSAVTVTDPKVSGLSCTPPNGSPLAPGASMSCTATHTVTQADIDAGHYANTACVNGGTASQQCATKDVDAVENPHLAITKQAAETTYSAVGNIIHYTIVATNDGNTTLAQVTVSDPNVSGITCTPANGSPLAPGASLSCTATHAITQADIDAGHYANTACVNGTPATQQCASKDVNATKNPHLAITKSATESNYDEVGDVIHYTIVATNDGNTTLPSVTVSDPNVQNLVCTPANGSPLAPGQSLNCTASHIVTQADLNAGHYANTACVNATGATQACDSEDVSAQQHPHLAITKQATESSYNAVGNVIHYTIVATNDGNVLLASVTVSDPKVGGLSCTPANNSPLAPGASMSCTATHTITQADIDAGHYANTACVNGSPAQQACANKDVDGIENPHLAIAKQSTESTYSAVGNVIHYTITATNDGNTTLSSVTVSDPKVIGLSCSPANGSTLAPGASMTCTATHTITQADLDAGHYANTACVVATGASTPTCATKDVSGNRLRAMTVDKTSTTSSLSSAPQTVNYSYLVTNTGNVTLTNLSLSDNNASGMTCPVTTLAPGASTTCTASHLFTAAEYGANGSPTANSGALANTVNASASSSDGPVTATDSLSIPILKPNLVVAKTPDAGTVQPGGTASFTILVTNTGGGPAFGVTLNDPLPGGLTWTDNSASCDVTNSTLSCTIGTIAAGGSFSVTVQASVPSDYLVQAPPAGGTTLEIDGNLTGTKDWDDLGIDCSSNPKVGCDLDKPTGKNDDSFGQGTKEDTSTPSVVSGAIPNNKSDLVRFYVASERALSSDFLYLAWERVQVPSGTTNMDFELNQSAQLSGNNVTPVRTAGDLLIKFDLENGGTVPSLGYHKWVTAASANGQTAAQACEASSSFPCWGKVQALSANVTAAVNTVSVTDPIAPPAGGRTLSPVTFGEASINLTATGIFQTGQCVSFGQAYLKSRSSSSFTAEIKDFIAPIPVTVSSCPPVVLNNTATASATNQSGTSSDTGKITVTASTSQSASLMLRESDSVSLRAAAHSARANDGVRAGDEVAVVVDRWSSPEWRSAPVSAPASRRDLIPPAPSRIGGVGLR